MGYCINFNTRTLPPYPAEDLPFLLAPEDWLKLHSPLQTAKYGFTPEKLGHTPEEFCEN